VGKKGEFYLQPVVRYISSEVLFSLSIPHERSGCDKPRPAKKIISRDWPGPTVGSTYAALFSNRCTFERVPPKGCRMYLK
jgi:hypothetical protein